MQTLFYLFILCAVASCAQEVHLFDMIESHGALLKIIEVVPLAIWSLAETGIMIAVLFMTKKRIYRIAPRYNSLWIALLVLCGLTGLFDIIDYGREESFITVMGIVVAFAMIAVMAVLGYKIAHNYNGKIRTLGNVFTFAPGICLIVMLLIMALLPDSFGELDTRSYDYGGAYIRYEQSHKTSTIVWTIVMAIVSALASIIPVGGCIQYLNATEESNNDISPEDESDNISETEAPQDLAVGAETAATQTSDSSEEEVSHNIYATDDSIKQASGFSKKKLALILGVIMIGIAGVAIWVFTKSDDFGGNSNIAAEAIYENGRKVIFTSKWFTDVEKTLNEQVSQESHVQSHKLDVIAHNGTTEPLPPHKDTTYDAGRLVDGNPSTAWAISFKPSENTQSPIWGPIIEFKENGKIDYVVIYNGYGKSEGLYKKNSRPAWITIYRPIAPDTGEPESEDILYEGPLEDTMEPQRLAVNKEFDFSRSIFHLIIKLPRYNEDNYYRGTAYDDLVISEIEFWGH